MKILSIRTSERLVVTPVGNRYYEVGNDEIHIYIVTDEGTFVFVVYKGFITNFRSGGWLVDLFIDQIGDEKKAIVYLVHDLIYTPCSSLRMHHPMSRGLGDQLLRDGLIYEGLKEWKAKIVYKSVRICGQRAYDEDDELTETNSTLFKFEWLDVA